MRRASAPERFLATILFTDIVASTEVATRLGDRAWRDLLDEFYERIRRELRRRGGRELDTAGDGLFAAFEAPGDAVACALAIRRSVSGLGIEVRSGLHVGEVERVGSKVGGIAVHIGARVAAAADPGGVFATSTVRDLTSGSGIAFEDRGEHRLRGVGEPWRLYAVLDAQEPASGAKPAARAARPLRRRRWFARHRRAAAAGGILAAVGVVGVGYMLASAPVSLSSVEANSVGMIDPERTAISGQASVGSQPSALAFGDGSLWVTNTAGGTVSRIDPERLTTVDTIQVGVAPEGIGFASGAVWVANSGDGTVSQINPSTNTEVATIPVGNGPADVAAGADSIWVTNSLDGTVSRIDPTAGAVIATVPVGLAPSALAGTGDSIWVANRDSGSVTELDARDGSVLTSINVGLGPEDMAVGLGSLWVVNRLDSTISRIDLESRRVIGTTVVPTQPSGVAVGDDAVWVTSPTEGTVVRIDPETSDSRSIPTESSPERIAVDDAGRLWFSARATIASHRGGTLRIAHPDDRPLSIDPHDEYWGWDITALTNDGLVAFRRVAGSGGGAIVPNLAASVPQASDDGLTYEFKLREGLGYSDGQPVLASHFRTAIERSFDGGGGLEATLGPYFFDRIVGADVCAEAAGSDADCDLSEGIQIDDDAGTITFTLTEPDPEFPYKLALPPAFAFPTGLADGDLTEPVPATGPYMVADSDDDHVRLVRNPEFAVRPSDARPDGFPDEIVWSVVDDADQAVDLVVEEAQDALLLRVPPERLDELSTRFTSQVHVFPSGTMFVFFNTTIAPFDQRSVREAISYAIDRERVVQLVGGPLHAAVTCQIIQPNFYGYRRICPHTSDPEAGVWTGPDFARARELIGDAGAAGAEVELMTIAVEPFPAVGEYITTVLEELGLRAELRAAGPEEFGPTVFAPDSQVASGLIAWFPDYPAPSTFIQTNFACASTGNLPRFCDPALDERMQEALELQSTDPVEAAAIWAELDAAITQQAAWAPLVTFNQTSFVSSRVGNVQLHPLWGVLVDQLWVE